MRSAGHNSIGHLCRITAFLWHVSIAERVAEDCSLANPNHRRFFWVLLRWRLSCCWRGSPRLSSRHLFLPGPSTSSSYVRGLSTCQQSTMWFGNARPRVEKEVLMSAIPQMAFKKCCIIVLPANGLEVCEFHLERIQEPDTPVPSKGAPLSPFPRML